MSDRDKHTKREGGKKRNGERQEQTMSIVPLGKTIMADKMRLLKRTQWSVIDSLGREENELH